MEDPNTIRAFSFAEGKGVACVSSTPGMFSYLAPPPWLNGSSGGRYHLSVHISQVTENRGRIVIIRHTQHRTGDASWSDGMHCPVIDCNID